MNAVGSTTVDAPWLDALAIERFAVRSIRSWQVLYRQWEVAAPYVVALTVVGVKGAEIPAHGTFFEGVQAIDRNELFLPEVLIVDHSQTAEDAMRPTFVLFGSRAAALEAAATTPTANGHKRSNRQVRYPPRATEI